MIAELQEPIPGRLMGWIHSRYASSNCDRCSSWEVPWNTYHIQQLNPLHWPVVSNIFYFTLSLWGLNVKGKIVFADKTQLYAWCCILILAKLLRDLEFLSVGFFFCLLPLPTISASTNDRHEVNENLLAHTELKHEHPKQHARKSCLQVWC